MRCHLTIIAALAGCAIVAVPAAAAGQTVTFAGVVVNQCVLTLTTPGVLGLSSTGTSLSSDETGGAVASLTVVATGTNPTLSFGSPTLTGPTASIAGATKEIGYSSPGGASQAYTTSASNYVMNRLLDVIAIKGRATNSNGFVSGTYSLGSTVTCQQ